MASSAISTEELEYQLEVAKADVAELQAAGNTSAAAAYFTIQATLSGFWAFPWHNVQVNAPARLYIF